MSDKYEQWKQAVRVVAQYRVSDLGFVLWLVENKITVAQHEEWLDDLLG